MDASDSRVGTTFGWYRIDGLLGRGGMGNVYRAYDQRRNRVVALKLLGARSADDGTFAERFRRECQAVARVEEPHVIPIHDYGEIDGTLFLDMRLIDGGNLRGLLSREGALNPNRAVAIAEQVAAALGAAHAIGIVHRDVKPENILLTSADFAYLVDFGIAVEDESQEARLTQTGTALGSTAYMAPEQFEGHPVTSAADVYSLATVLYEMLTGRPAHSGASLSQVLRSVLVGPVTPASQIRTDLPPSIDPVLARAMSQNPQERYSSPEELVAAARSALDRGAPPASARTRVETRPSDEVYAATAIAPAVNYSQGNSGAQQMYPSVTSPRAEKSLTALWVIGAFFVIGALVAIITLLILRDDDGPSQNAEPSTSQETPAAAPPPVDTTTLVQTVEPPPTETVYRSEPGQFGIGLNTYRHCDAGPARAVFTGYETTTCPFATNVARRLVGLNPDSGPLTITADSPTAGPGMVMNCRRAQDSNLHPLWKCQGGRSGNAVVYVYP